MAIKKKLSILLIGALSVCLFFAFGFQIDVSGEISKDGGTVDAALMGPLAIAADKAEAALEAAEQAVLDAIAALSAVELVVLDASGAADAAEQAVKDAEEAAVLAEQAVKDAEKELEELESRIPTPTTCPHRTLCFQ